MIENSLSLYLSFQQNLILSVAGCCPFNPIFTEGFLRMRKLPHLRHLCQCRISKDGCDKLKSLDH